MKRPITAQRRVLVTGSRGKSSLVRLIHAACAACGLQAYGRITGVLPRQLEPEGESLILRRSGAHVREMAWWLGQLPGESDAVVLENSAISPELQHLAARWLKPSLVVLTNALPDHQQAWGATSARAMSALAGGIPRQSPVAVPAAVAYEPIVSRALAERGCRVIPAQPDSGEPSDGHLTVNRGLALAACGLLGLDPVISRRAVRSLEPDLADFKVESLGKGGLGLAFAANDPASTESLFLGLDWPHGETSLLFNHRADRPDRLKAFAGFMGRAWREVIITGDRPWRMPVRSRYLKLRQPSDLTDLVAGGGRFFGCGNLAGMPLRYLLASSRRYKSLCA